MRGVIANTTEEGRMIVLVMHSAGGFIGSQAAQELRIEERADRDRSGGVAKLVFLAGAVFPKGHEHGPLPFFD